MKKRASNLHVTKNELTPSQLFCKDLGNLKDNYITEHVWIATSFCFLVNFNLINWRYNICFKWLFYIFTL